MESKDKEYNSAVLGHAHQSGLGGCWPHPLLVTVDITSPSLPTFQTLNTSAFRRHPGHFGKRPQEAGPVSAEAAWLPPSLLSLRRTLQLKAK